MTDDAEFSPETTDEDVQDIIERGRRMDFILETDWIAEELERYFADPAVFSDEGLFEQPETATQERYTFFQLAFLAGIEYENRYPREQRDEWDVYEVG